MLPTQYTGPLERLQRLRDRAAGAAGLRGDRLVGGEAAAAAAIVEAPEQRLQDLEEGSSNRALMLPRLAVPGAPGPRVGGDTAFGIAVQRHGGAGAKHL